MSSAQRWNADAAAHCPASSSFHRVQANDKQIPKWVVRIHKAGGGAIIAADS